MRIDVIASVPGIVSDSLAYSIVKRAIAAGKARIEVHDVRDYTTDHHRQVDDYPFGGGGGMVLKPEPVFAAYEKLLKDREKANTSYDEVIYLTPDGEVFTQSLANRLSLCDNLLIIAGHYKGVDQRIRDQLVTREISIGDYVISGGEQAAIVVIDAVVRLLPGVLGDATSALSDSFQDGLLDAPQYTRPAIFRGYKVPDVLLSGDHRAIDNWRDEERLRKTRERRPDLLDSETPDSEQN